MTDDRTDSRIRALMVELVDATPTPPTWESIQARLAETAGADPALDAAARTTAEGAPAMPSSDLTTIDLEPGAETVDDLPEYAKHEERRTPRWRPIAAATGAVGVLIGGTFAYAAFNGPDGAASPEAAVEQFVGSVTDEDLIGAIESLPASEREVLADTARDLAAEAQRLGLTEGLDAGDVGGFEIELDGLSTTVEELGDGVAAVHLDGTLTSDVTGAELPLSDVVFGALGDVQGFESGVGDLARVFDEEDVFVVAIEEDGGWHASAWYTVAEYLRRASDAPLPTFGDRPVAPVGAESPEAATRAYIAATSSGDLRTALGLMDPDEGRVLYDYGPVALGRFDPNDGTWPTAWTVDRLDLTTTEADGRTVVSMTGFDYTVVDDYGTTRLSFDGDCYETTQTPADPQSDGGGTDEGPYCRADALAEGTPGWAWDTSFGAEYVTVERDGRWFLSPARSIATTVLSGARAIPDGGLTPEMIDEGAPWGLLWRAYNLLPLPYGGAGWTYGFSSGESCFSTVDAEGNTYEECRDGSSEFDSVGTPIDPDGSVDVAPTTVVHPADVVPTEATETTVDTIEAVGTPVDPETDAGVGPDPETTVTSDAPATTGP